jgi:hypothetical protein
MDRRPLGHLYNKFTIVKTGIWTTITNLREADDQRHSGFGIIGQQNSINIADLDSTTRRAITLCVTALEDLEHHHPELVHPQNEDPAVEELINLWYSPIFNCTKDVFWQVVHIQATTRHNLNNAAHVTDHQDDVNGDTGRTL